MVLLRPSDTFESVAADLRNAVGVEMRCRQPPQQQYLTGNDDLKEDEADEQY